jgi:hypothetical protein
MTRAPNWTEDEFETLLNNPHSSDEELADLLPQRTPDAVGVVRAFVHNYHLGGSMSGIGNMMVQRLEQGSVTCPVCYATF